jgi:subtilisin family serine protease
MRAAAAAAALLALLMPLYLAPTASAEPHQPRVILKLRPAVGAAAAPAGGRDGLPGFRVVAPKPGESAAAAAARLAALPGVEAVEVDRPVRIAPIIVPPPGAAEAPVAADAAAAAADADAAAALRGGGKPPQNELLPNDPRWGEQWGAAAARAPAAWARAATAASAAAAAAGAGPPPEPPTVCVIDTGVDYTHPDLAPSVHPARGWNALTNSSDPMDDNGHGTHCAGTVGAAWGNARGTAGLAGPAGARILACKFLDAEGAGQVSGIVQCLDYCLRMGAQVSSNSYAVLGLEAEGSVVAAAIAAAGAAGHLFVAAAGNTGADNDAALAPRGATGGPGRKGAAGEEPAPAPGSGPAFPAAFGVPTMIAVAAAELAPGRGGALQLASYSNRGPRTTHLTAPGSAVLSTWPGGGYALQSGTSMAAPHVAGAAALLLGAARGRLGGAEARAALLATARRAPAFEGAVETGGFLDAAAALEWALDAAQLRAPLDAVVPLDAAAAEGEEPLAPPLPRLKRLPRARAHPLGGRTAAAGGVEPRPAWRG